MSQVFILGINLPKNSNKKIRSRRLRLSWIKKTDVLGSINVVHSNNNECFYLRTLNHVIKGPTSFHIL